MQERSTTLPMCSVDQSSFIPTTNHSLEGQRSSTLSSHEFETENESSTSTPELNLLLVKNRKRQITK